MTWRTRVYRDIKRKGVAFVPVATAGRYASDGCNEMGLARAEMQRLCEQNGWQRDWNNRLRGWFVTPVQGQEDSDE